MLYGIQASKDVKLSNISRSLREEQALIKTENRLSRNLDDEDFSDIINNEIIRPAKNKITDDMVIAIDPGDIRKKYAKKMEYLTKIYDSSEKGVGIGYYSLCKVVATDINNKKVIPLYFELYSLLHKDVKSENDQIYKAIDMLYKHIGKTGVHAIDRGGDRGYIYYKYLFCENPQKFVIRLKKRDLIYNNKRADCETLSKMLPCPHETKIIVYREGREITRIIKYNAIKVKLPG